ncbi:hypothetical protein AB4Z18_11365 [Leifsonia sp. 2TAF2]|uniref:hypothetical protein n=1 Tax=Leifsonia sp. 2TAF2 TaxID=3233009 RepID=UPI003F9C9ED8
MTIGLPSASTSADATPLRPGVVSYDSKNGSTIVPIVERSGTMQLNTVIAHGRAPSRYSYPLTVPKGQSLALAPDGAAYVSGAGKVSAYFPEPWAKDANGRDVPTHFEIKGNTLTQVVDLASASAFPVVADPQFAWHLLLPSVKTNRSETKQLTGIGAGPAGVGAAAKACSAVVKVAGAVGATLCGLNVVSIMFNASKAWYDGKCAQLLIGPGVIGTIPYKDGYCR